MNKILIAKNLTKNFKTKYVETTAVNNISFEVEKGEFIVLHGPSGCGKSTLLSILGLMAPYDSGDLFICGQDIKKLSNKRKAIFRNKQLGFIFQSFNLISDLSVLDNVLLPHAYNKDVDMSSVIDSAHSILNDLGLSTRASHFPHEISGGQQQRVAFARAILTNPELILADEPTGNLDSKSADQLMSLLCEQHKNGATVILVTHDSRYLDLGRRICLLDGNISKGEV